MELALGRLWNAKAAAGKQEVSTFEENIENLKSQLCDIKEDMQNIRSKFDMTADEDLIEAYIYEMEALEARYRSVLKKAKLLKVV